MTRDLELESEQAELLGRLNDCRVDADGEARAERAGSAALATLDASSDAAPPSDELLLCEPPQLPAEAGEPRPDEGARKLAADQRLSERPTARVSARPLRTWAGGLGLTLAAAAAALLWVNRPLREPPPSARAEASEPRPSSFPGASTPREHGSEAIAKAPPARERAEPERQREAPLTVADLPTAAPAQRRSAAAKVRPPQEAEQRVAKSAPAKPSEPEHPSLESMQPAAEAHAGPVIQPSIGDLYSALQRVRGPATACLSPGAPAVVAAIVFRSDGSVARVHTPADLEAGRAACVRSSLAAARVPEFARAEYSANITLVRPGQPGR